MHASLTFFTKAVNQLGTAAGWHRQNLFSDDNSMRYWVPSGGSFGPPVFVTSNIDIILKSHATPSISE